MKVLLSILMFFCIHQGFSQQINTVEENEVFEKRSEDLSQENEAESENDDNMQQLQYYMKHPVDLNGSELQQISLLDPLLIGNLATYRHLLGDIIDIHELQAVPGFTIEIIKSILPYITVNKDRVTYAALSERFIKGNQSILIRSAIIPQKSEGYNASGTQKFTGSRSALFVRYKYQYRNLLQYGFAAEKDAGENLFVNRMLPDFVSFHIFAKRTGIFKSVAVGDYTINLGQGLIHWQNQAVRKSSSVINIKRQSEVLRPYHAAGEYNFHRGVAATIALGKSDCTVFWSVRKITANIDSGTITSVNTSGLHRTQSELNDKHSAILRTAGINIKKTLKSGHIGLNAIHYLYDKPVLKKDESYNVFALKGKRWMNYSTDYNYTFRNFHFFGEIAATQIFSFACINGVMASLSQTLDLALVQRSIGKSYQSIYGNAFTENTMPSNENGFYTGISLKPHDKWKVDLYADIFSFPWLKYRLSAPATGAGYFIQLSFRPGRKTEIYSRFRYRLKPIDFENEEEEFKIPGIQSMQNWRTQVSQQITRNILFRSRVELCLVRHHFPEQPRTGYLFYADLHYKPLTSWLSGNIRFQVFEAEDYETRLYAYENDLMFVSSTPSFYNKGTRYYLNLKARFRIKILINNQLTINLKAASTVYNNISCIGTGPDRIPGNRESSVKLQFLLGYY